MHTQIANLYNNVIDDFITLVQKQYRGKNIFTNETIEKMEKLIRSKIKNTQQYNSHIVNNFFQQAIKFAQRPQQKQVKPINDMSLLKLQQSGSRQLNQPMLKKSNQQQEQDDLNQFKNTKIIQKQVHNQPQQQIKLKEEEQSFDFDQGDLDQKLTGQELEKIKDKSGLHILGQYHTKQKKFNSKKQQTKLTIYNAWLKIEGHDQQVLFPVVQLVLKRISKSKLSY